MLRTALVALLISVTPRGDPDIDPDLDPWAMPESGCPPPEAWLDGDRSPKSIRRDARERMSITWKAMGLDLEARKVLDAIVARESSWDPCAVHVLGEGEFGLGPGGLSVELHKAKWNAEAPDDVLRVPEVSAVIMARIFRRARDRYKARTWKRAGAIYGGRVSWKHLDRARDARFCHRLRLRGIDCTDPITELGERLGHGPTPNQIEFVRELIEARAEA